MAVTKKFPIEYTVSYSTLAVYKVYFGSHYFIWKSKAVKRGLESLAEQIERHVRLGRKLPDTDYLYHVINHIRRTRCIKAKVEMIQDDFDNTWEALVLEQQLLDQGDEKCLNNNSDAYMSSWISEAEQKKFSRNYKKQTHI